MERIWLVCLLMVVFAAGAYADGIIIPHPMPPYPHPEWLEIEYHHVDIIINNQFTETHIDQVFHNPNRWDLEGDYVFPLPEGAAVQNFSMFVDDVELEGEVLDKDKARQLYEDHVREMKDPALLEYIDRNTFKARVYPIEAHGDKRIKMSYSEIISCEDGLCEYTYPLNTEKFSSTDLESVKVRASIVSSVPIKSVYSPTHDIEITRIDDYSVDVSYEAEDVKPYKDFKLVYTISEKDIDINLVTYKEPAEDGFFMLMLAPKFSITQQQGIPKDVICVLDTSGSMAGEKIVQAKEALRFVLNSLNDADMFGLVTFSDEVDVYEDELQVALPDNLAWAHDYVNGIQATGGTDIQSALLKALRMFPDDDRPKMVIFLTDGKPTVGVQDVGQILEDVDEQNLIDARIFVFGVGYEVNTHLLDKLSLENHGVSSYVEPEEDIEVKVSNFYSKVSNPVMADPEILVDGVEVFDMYPSQLPDIFRGTQITVLGRFDRAGEAMISLKGDVAGEEMGLVFEKYFDDSTDNDYLPRVWASRKIGYLMDTIRLEGENEALIDEIIELSKRYGIITPYTSFLVLEDESLEDMRDRASEEWGAAFAPQVGADAVMAAESLAGYKGATSAGANELEVDGVSIKYVGSKAFILKDGVWTDTTYADEETDKLKYGSDKYFDTMSDNPELGRFLAVGENVIVCIGETCIEVREDYTGEEDDITIVLPEPEEPECRTDGDCELDLCTCTCKFPDEIDSTRLCGINCLGEYGVSGCKCISGRCTAVSEPVVRESICGDGICQDDETSASCPDDCRVAPVYVEPKEDPLITLLWLALVILVLATIIVVAKKVLEKDSKKKKK